MKMKPEITQHWFRPHEPLKLKLAEDQGFLSGIEFTVCNKCGKPLQLEA